MLRWHESPTGRLPRDEIRHDAHGRRLKSGGVLQGALHTLGYVRRHLLPLCRFGS